MRAGNRPNFNTGKSLTQNGGRPAGAPPGSALERNAPGSPSASMPALRGFFAPGTPASAAATPDVPGGPAADGDELAATLGRPRRTAGVVAGELAAAAAAAGLETEGSSRSGTAAKSARVVGGRWRDAHPTGLKATRTSPDVEFNDQGTLPVRLARCGAARGRRRALPCCQTVQPERAARCPRRRPSVARPGPRRRRPTLGRTRRLPHASGRCSINSQNPCVVVASAILRRPRLMPSASSTLSRPMRSRQGSPVRRCVKASVNRVASSTSRRMSVIRADGKRPQYGCPANSNACSMAVAVRKCACSAPPFLVRPSLAGCGTSAVRSGPSTCRNRTVN